MFDLQAATDSVHLADPEAVAEHLASSIKEAVRRFRCTGAVIALSGGIDSSVSVGLAARGLGSKRVRAIALPDKESSQESASLAAEVADTFGVGFAVRDITPALDALGCYADRLAVVRGYVPGFDPEAGDRFSVEFDPAVGDANRLTSFTLHTVVGGEPSNHRLSGRDFRIIMAATNQKQRIRMLSTYRVADEHNLVVVGTSNRPELDQGFFVKHGDGCGEVFPLSWMLKSHVYDLAAVLGVPDGVRQRPPTTDTFSADQTQEEYFYGTSIEVGDRLWLAWHRAESPESVAAELGLTVADVEKFFALYTRRSQYAAYLRETL